jgi:hypothetical protein
MPSIKDQQRILHCVTVASLSSTNTLFAAEASENFNFSSKAQNLSQKLASGDNVDPSNAAMHFFMSPIKVQQRILHCVTVASLSIRLG